MPFAGYEDFDECVRKNKDKKDPKAYCAEIKRKTEKSVQVLAVFEEDSKTPAIDTLIGKFAKGGPGSGQKGHTTAKKETYESNRAKSEKFFGALSKKFIGEIQRASTYQEVADNIYTKVIAAEGVPGQQQARMNFVFDVNEAISSKWSPDILTKVVNRAHRKIRKDKKSGKKPLHRKEIPKMDESVKAKKISERLKSESTSKTPSIDELIVKGGPGSGQKGHKTVHEKHQENRKDFISFIVKMKKRGMDNDDIVNMLSELKITKTPAIDALIAKGGVGSGVKGHTTAKELAIKKKFGELDKARNKADALAEKDIRDGQRMIDKAAKESEVAFEELLTIGMEGSEAQFKKTSEKRDKLKKQEQAGWDLRIKGQNRKAEISDKYSEASRKLMGIHSDSRTEVPIGTMGETVTGTMGEPFKSKVTSHEDSMIKVENIIKEIFPKYPLDYSGDLVTVSTLGNGDTLLSAYVPTNDRGTDPNIREPSKKELSNYEDKWKPSMARLQNALRIKGFRDMKVTLDYGEKGHIGLRVSGTLEKVKPLGKEKVQKSKTLTYEEADAKTKKINEKWYKLNDKQNKEAVAISEAKTPQEHKDRTQKYLKTKAEFDQATKDLKAAQNERARIEISEEKMSDEVKLKGKEQPTLTRDAPKHTPKSNLLATKHAEAAVKRGMLFKELGKKSKKELKGMIQQDSKVDMAGSLKQMTKSDMKYHITSGKYPSPKGSEEAYNALTKQERKGTPKTYSRSKDT